MTSGNPKHPEDPGRDPEGLSPPRDVLTAAEGASTDGTFTPGKNTETQHANEPPDRPPTSSGTGNP